MGTLAKRLLAPVLARLGSRTIVTVGGTLFLLNMLVPDPLPLVDEFLILAGTILLSRWAQSAEGVPHPGAEAANTGEPKHVGRGSTRADTRN